MWIRNGFQEFFCLRSNLSNDDIISAWIKAWGSFLEIPDNKRARKAVLVYERGFSSFASDAMKLWKVWTQESFQK